MRLNRYCLVVKGKQMDKLLAPEAVNSGRQTELDIAKFVVLAYMPLVHAAIECVPEDALVSGIPYLMDTILGGPLGAPIFMMAMGIGMVYSKKQAAADYAKRGLRLLVLGYALNVCRFLIPYLAGYAMTGNYDKYIRQLPYLVFENDIMVFAGLAMLAVAAFVHFGLSGASMLIISLALSLFGTFMKGFDAGNPAANVILGLFIGTEDAAGLVRSYFVFCNWLIVPVSGYVFGKMLIRVSHKRRFYLAVSPAAGILAAVYMAAGIHSGFGMFGEGQNCYYHLITSDAIASIAMVIALLGLYYAVSAHLGRTLRALVLDVSRNINAIYCIHWVLINVIINVVMYSLRGRSETNIYTALVIGAAISCASMLIAHVWRGIKTASKRESA